jgi:hypothetical protein
MPLESSFHQDAARYRKVAHEPMHLPLIATCLGGAFGTESCWSRYRRSTQVRADTQATCQFHAPRRRWQVSGHTFNPAFAKREIAQTFAPSSIRISARFQLARTGETRVLKPITMQRIGTLDDDLTSIAGAVHHALSEGPRMVWIDDEKQVFLGDSQEAHFMPAHWIVGTFNLGHSLGEIEGDLRAVANERANDSMMD